MRTVRWVRGSLRWGALLALSSALSIARAQSLGDEALAKAKIVTAMLRFVQWPVASFEHPGSPIRLCVYTQSQGIERAFQGYDRFAVGQRTLQLAFNPPADAPACHAAYLDGAAGPKGVRREVDSPIFTVGTADGFIERGGMVEVVSFDNALRFDVNLDAVRSAGLTINPGVLKLARHVKQ